MIDNWLHILNLSFVLISHAKDLASFSKSSVLLFRNGNNLSFLVLQSSYTPSLGLCTIAATLSCSITSIDAPSAFKWVFKLWLPILSFFTSLWALFWFGDLISKIMELTDDGLPWRLYPLYNKCMGWSVDVQDWAGLSKPWRKNNGWWRKTKLGGLF